MCAVVVFLGAQYVAPAAATYKISGYVKTSGGIALPSATVTLDGKSAITDSNGYYEFTGLEGNKSYSLAVSSSGYESSSATVQLGTQNEQADDITLKIAEVTKPLAAIKSALATQESVSTDNVKLYFCEQAAVSDNWAAGAVINQQKSMVIFYLESTGGVTVENSYTAATTDEQSVMSTLAEKQIFSRFTNNEIVPFNIVKQGSTYTFDYYDGYVGYYQQQWGFGTAVMDENGDVPEDNMTHAWI